MNIDEAKKWLEEMKINFIFAWYDLWIGFYYDKKNRCLYFLPLPMIGIQIQFGKKKGHIPDVWNEWDMYE